MGCSAFGFVSFIGTNVIPHLGHWPGPARTTSGCIGQVYLCAGDAEGDAETFGDWVVCAITAPTAQMIAKIDNVDLVLISKLFGFGNLFCSAGVSPIRTKL